MALVRAFVAMLPRLDASERLAAINDRALAFGSFDKDTASKMLDRLQRVSGGERRRRSIKATPEVLAGMGIRIVGAPAEGAESNVSEPSGEADV